GVLAVAMLAKKTLDTTRLVAEPFPTDILDATPPLDAAARVRLQKYGRARKRFKGMSRCEGRIRTTSVARGLATLIVSVWTLTIHATEDGREIWHMLRASEPHVETAYRFMLRRDVNEVDRDYLAYRPRIFFDA